MKSDLEQLLLKIKGNLPDDKKKAFANKIAARWPELSVLSEQSAGTIATCTVTGAAIGAILDTVPFLETLTGVDGFIDVGASIGAFVGLAKSEKERRTREEIKRIIITELNALAKA